MEDDARRPAALDRIRQNIAQHGHHICVVSGAPKPRFAFTTGLEERLRAELILAGAILYLYDQVLHIINEIAAKLKLMDGWETSTYLRPSGGSPGR